MKEFVKLFLFIILVTGGYTIFAQTNTETEVPLLQNSGSISARCYSLENAVYDEQKFNNLTSAENCSNPKTILNIDFTKQTLIGYQVRGDCQVHGFGKVFRNESAKTYQVKITTIFGSCRASGQISGWLIIDKIPAEYKVEFSEFKVDGLRNELNRVEFENSTPKKDNAEILESREIDLKGCIQTIFTRQFVIKDEATYLKTIRNDASRDFCLKNLEKIDFTKNSLLGLEINSGYCERPSGLKFQVIKDEKAKNYLFNIVYDPKGAICRALSQYDLWVIVQKIPDGFEVKFDVEAK